MFRKIDILKPECGADFIEEILRAQCKARQLQRVGICGSGLGVEDRAGEHGADDVPGVDVWRAADSGRRHWRGRAVGFDQRRLQLHRVDDHSG